MTSGKNYANYFPGKRHYTDVVVVVVVSGVGGDGDGGSGGSAEYQGNKFR